METGRSVQTFADLLRRGPLAISHWLGNAARSYGATMVPDGTAAPAGTAEDGEDVVRRRSDALAPLSYDVRLDFAEHVLRAGFHAQERVRRDSETGMDAVLRASIEEAAVLAVGRWSEEAGEGALVALLDVLVRCRSTDGIRQAAGILRRPSLRFRAAWGPAIGHRMVDLAQATATASQEAVWILRNIDSDQTLWSPRLGPLACYGLVRGDVAHWVEYLRRHWPSFAGLRDKEKQRHLRRIVGAVRLRDCLARIERDVARTVLDDGEIHLHEDPGLLEIYKALMRGSAAPIECVSGADMTFRCGREVVTLRGPDNADVDGDDRMKDHLCVLAEVAPTDSISFALSAALDSAGLDHMAQVDMFRESHSNFIQLYDEAPSGAFEQLRSGTVH